MAKQLLPTFVLLKPSVVEWICKVDQPTFRTHLTSLVIKETQVEMTRCGFLSIRLTKTTRMSALSTREV